MFNIKGSASATGISNFKDVPSTYWAKEAIDSAVTKGYFKGYADGTFKPNATVTRAEFAALLARASTNSEVSNNGSTFSDLKGHWSEQEVNRAISMGFISTKDYPTGFSPSTPLTRREMSKWLASGLAAKDADFKQALDDTKDTLIPVVEYYKGGLSKSDYSYVSTVLGTGLLGGYPDGTFGPNNVTTRAEAAVILQRFESVQNKQAQDFRGLKELREVGTTGTNLTTVTPYKYVDPKYELKDILGKNILLRYGAGKVQLHHLIVMNVKAWNDINSIYGPMFIDKTSKLPYVNDQYHVFIDVSVIPVTQNFVQEHFSNGGFSRLYAGNRIGGNVTTTYGYKSLPFNGDPSFFSKGKETRFWAQTSIDNKLRAGAISSVYQVNAEDGTSAEIILGGDF
nr:S-layer homology domain-containing protein [Paenibacillus sediminis]